MCSGATMYRSITESQIRPNQWAVFLGAGGGVGHMGVQIAKAMGCRVIGVDGGADKRALCVDKLGCDVFIDFFETSDVAAEVVKAADGLGAHVVFVTASSKQAYGAAPKMLRVGGKVMCVGLPPVNSVIVGDDPNVSRPP